MSVKLTIAEPQLRQLLTFWRERCSGGGLPVKRDFDPVVLFALLPYPAFVEVLGDGEEFRIRLAGSEIEDRFGHSLRGLSVYDSNRGVEVPDPTDQWLICFESDWPCYRRGPVRLHDTRHFDCCRLILPIAANDGPADRAAFILAGALLKPVTRREWETGDTIARELDPDTVAAIVAGDG